VNLDSMRNKDVYHGTHKSFHYSFRVIGACYDNSKRIRYDTSKLQVPLLSKYSSRCISLSLVYLDKNLPRDSLERHDIARVKSRAL